MNLKTVFCAAALSLVSQVSYATPALDFWATDGWTQIADDDGVGSGGRVFPGWGGQDFDAEYLFYQISGSTLSFGLQTGFDLIDGKVRYRGKNYFAGDLGVSFNGGGFDYAVDFGLKTRDIDGHRVDADTSSSDGIDVAGLYAVTEWNNDISFGASAPFGMDGGTLITGLTSNNAGYNATHDTYFRTVSFDISGLSLGNTFDFDLHWTMSCGNDEIVGGATVVQVAEPFTLLLFGVGAFSLFASRRRLSKK